MRLGRHRRRGAVRFGVVTAILATVLAGCGMFGSSSSSDTPTAAPAASCPSASILKPLSQTAVFAPGAAHQPLGVGFYGILSDVTVNCEGSGPGLRATLDVVVIGERGPAASGSTGLDLQYFVAVTGPDQSILSKRSFPVHIDIPATSKRGGITDHIEQPIPLAGRGAGDVSIVLGFQQSPEIVDFYRHFRGR